MSEQHNPARTPLGPEVPKWRKAWRNKQQELTAGDFKLGERVIGVIKHMNGFQIHVLLELVDIYETKVLSYWNSRYGLHLYGRVLDVSRHAGSPLHGHLVSLSIDRSSWSPRGEPRLTDLPLEQWDQLKETP